MKILGFDIGITSVGWAFVENSKLKDCGVRIFSEAQNPKDGSSLALPRREARSARKRLRHRKSRLNKLKKLICKEFSLNLSDYKSSDGILPNAYKNKLTNIYELRANGLNEKLEKPDLARVILHIAKHRGYGNKNARDDDSLELKTDKKSNMESKTQKDKEQGAQKAGILSLRRRIKESGAKSVGEYFYWQTKDNKPARNKSQKEPYCNTPLQLDLEEELKNILDAQQRLGTEFSDEFKNEILKEVFFQLPLKSFKNLVGTCSLFKDEPRAPKDSPSAVEFIALGKIINEMQYLKKKTGEIYNKNIVNSLLSSVLENGEISYKTLRQILNLASEIKFRDLEYDKKNAESKKFIEFKKYKAFKKAFGDDYNKFEKELDNIATDLAIIKDKNELNKKLQKYKLDSALIEALSKINFSGFVNFSLKAINIILPKLKEYKTLDEAKEEAKSENKIPSKQNELNNSLPPIKDYEPYLANPVVERALVQFRKVLNALIKKYGKMDFINIELSRDINSKKIRNEIKNKQNRNKKARESAEEKCRDKGIENNEKNILKLRLWEEQREFCIYCGEKIGIDDLREKTNLEIDHIYPYSKSYDDSYNNKVLVHAKCNQAKLNKTPFEAWGDKEKWDKIKGLIKNLPKSKKKRILNEKFEYRKEGEFKERNINDTRYIVRLASNWVKDNLDFNRIENENPQSGQKGSKERVKVMNGILTKNLRHFWGLDDLKNRENHIHHALDAIVVAFATTKTIQDFSKYYKETCELKKTYKINENIERDGYDEIKVQYESQSEILKKNYKFYSPIFRNEVIKKLDNIFVSQPPRGRMRGALHEEKFYSKKKFEKEYGGELGVEKALELGKIRKIGNHKIVANSQMLRVDIFSKNNKFYAVPIYAMDCALACKNEGYIPNKAVVVGKNKDKTPKDWLEMDSSYEFKFSLVKNDLIKIQKKDMDEAELCYFNGFDVSGNTISIEKHNNKYTDLSENEAKLFTDKEKTKKDKDGNKIPNDNKKIIGGRAGIQNLKIFEKYQVDILGKEIKKIDFKLREKITLARK